MGLSLVGSMLVTQGDVLLLGRLASPAVVGVYSVALALASRLDTLNQSVFTIMMPRASRLEGARSIRGYWRQVTLGSLGLAGLLAVAALLAQPAIVWLYGERYTASAGIFFTLLVVVLFDLATSSLFLLVFPLNKPRMLAAADWLRVAVLGVSGWLLIPMYGAYGAVAARFLARVTGTALALLGLRRAMERSEELENGDQGAQIRNGL
jgi:O-antigen/teichoic acid export membrane protein